MIAVSSILSYDLNKTYLNPRVTDKGLVHVSHLWWLFMECPSLEFQLP
jgi:Na+/proline symporter